MSINKWTPPNNQPKTSSQTEKHHRNQNIINRPSKLNCSQCYTHFQKVQQRQLIIKAWCMFCHFHNQDFYCHQHNRAFYSTTRSLLCSAATILPQNISTVYTKIYISHKAYLDLLWWIIKPLDIYQSINIEAKWNLTTNKRKNSRINTLQL